MLSHWGMSNAVHNQVGNDARPGHSSETPQTTRKPSLNLEAGLPPGTFSRLLGGSGSEGNKERIAMWKTLTFLRF